MKQDSEEKVMRAVRKKKELDLLNGNIRNLFFRYFGTVIGASCIPCAYGIVDMAVVGKYYGPDGTAAYTVVMPIFNIIYSLGILVGIGGSVLLSTERGKDPDNVKGRNQYFTAALIGACIIGLAVWVIFWLFEDPLLLFFGADEELLPLSRQYMNPIRIAAPVFVFDQLFAAFLRNDNAPGRATLAVLISGIFNVFGDLFFVFGLDMGIRGAALATSLGACINLGVMLTHLLSKKNTLHLVRVQQFFVKTRQILTTGFATFFADFALFIVNVLFNRQIMKYLGTDALSVFGILMNINTFVQCCGYSSGQAAQPIFSVNFGAGKTGRIRETLRYAVGMAVVFGIGWTVLALVVPNAFVRLFMSPTDEVLAIAPRIIRTFGLAFLLLPFNVVSTYYFQSLMKPKTAFAVSVSRGLVLCAVFIFALPALFGADAIWFTMPLSEAITAVFAAVMMARYTKKL